MRRDSVYKDEALNDYQWASQRDEGIVYSPKKYRETEGITEKESWRNGGSKTTLL